MCVLATPRMRTWARSSRTAGATASRIDPISASISSWGPGVLFSSGAPTATRIFSGPAVGGTKSGRWPITLRRIRTPGCSTGCDPSGSASPRTAATPALAMPRCAYRRP